MRAAHEAAIREAALSGDRGALESALASAGAADAASAPRIASAIMALASAGALAPRPAGDPAWPPLGDADSALLARASEGLGPEEARLLAAMARCCRARPHPTGRCRYSDAELMRESGIRQARAYRAAFASLCAKGLARAAVVGSKRPVTTVELPWLTAAGAGGE